MANVAETGKNIGAPQTETSVGVLSERDPEFCHIRIPQEEGPDLVIRFSNPLVDQAGFKIGDQLLVTLTTDARKGQISQSYTLRPIFEARASQQIAILSTAAQSGVVK